MIYKNPKPHIEVSPDDIFYNCTLRMRCTIKPELRKVLVPSLVYGKWIETVPDVIPYINATYGKYANGMERGYKMSVSSFDGVVPVKNTRVGGDVRWDYEYTVEHARDWVNSDTEGGEYETTYDDETGEWKFSSDIYGGVSSKETLGYILSVIAEKIEYCEVYDGTILYTFNRLGGYDYNCSFLYNITNGVLCKGRAKGKRLPGTTTPDLSDFDTVWSSDPFGYNALIPEGILYGNLIELNQQLVEAEEKFKDELKVRDDEYTEYVHAAAASSPQRRKQIHDFLIEIGFSEDECLPYVGDDNHPQLSLCRFAHKYQLYQQELKKRRNEDYDFPEEWMLVKCAIDRYERGEFFKDVLSKYNGDYKAYVLNNPDFLAVPKSKFSMWHAMGIYFS